MKRLFTSILLLAAFIGMSQAIQFHKFDAGLENNGYMTGLKSMYYDTIDKKLYVSGQFKTAGNKIVWGAAVWDGQTWDSLKGGLTQFPQQVGSPGTPSEFASEIIRYKNKIYFAGGGIIWVNGKNQYNLGIWNGTGWDYPLPQPSPSGNSINDMIVYNDTLYACGMFTAFGSVTCNYVAKYDGNSWHPVGNFSSYCKNGTPAVMSAIEVYQNEIYVAGAWDDVSGTPRNIAKFNGSSWVNVGTGIKQGGLVFVECLKEFNNKLYIGGLFGKTSEIPGEGFVSWNGTSYEQVHSFGLSNGDYIRYFKKHNNKLFVMGPISSYGPLPVKNIFYIDTQNNACMINGLESTFSHSMCLGFDRCEFIGDSLVIGGLFQYLDTMRVNNIGAITNFESNSTCQYVSIEESYLDNLSIKVYPNPVKDKVTIEFEGDNLGHVLLELRSLLGETLFIMDAPHQKEEIDMGSFPQGVYFLTLYGGVSKKVLKVMKE